MAGKKSDNPNVFLLPDLGEGLQDAELIEWMVKPGQEVTEFDILAKVETDKALADVPADRSGTIAELHGAPGERMKVDAPFVTYESNGASGAPKKVADSTHTALQRSMEQGAAPEAEQKQRVREQAKEEEREDAGTVVGSMQNAPSMEAGPGKVIATPAVRRIARDLGVDLSEITGTGIGGRITESNVRAMSSGSASQNDEEPPPAARPPMRAASGQSRAPVRSPSHPGTPLEARMDQRRPAAQAPDSPAAIIGSTATRIPFRGVRRTIAERLRQSVNHAIHFCVMDEVDVSALDEQRKRLIAASGEKISFLPFVAAAVCRVLAGRAGSEFNRLNSTVDDAASEIIQHRSVHLGIATDTPNGLMVPVIRDADKLGVLEIQRHVNNLANGARERTLGRDQLMGSTFTISNVGSLAGKFATPIINYPEAGILAVGRARDGVVVRKGMIGIGKLLPLSLTADHRVVDGGTAATALAKIIELLQSPDELLAAR